MGDSACLRSGCSCLTATLSEMETDLAAQESSSSGGHRAAAANRLPPLFQLSRHFPYFPSTHKSPSSLNPIAWFLGLSCLQLV